jgi:hypothetical protein
MAYFCHFELSTVDNINVLARLTFFDNFGVPVTTNYSAVLNSLPKAFVAQSKQTWYAA